MKRIAVYPGTFDPVTNGHLDLVDRGRHHFDRLVLAILGNEEKEPMFSGEERLAFLNANTASWDNVEVDQFDGLLVDYADRVGASFILRGIRAVTDFESELQMAMMNRRLRPRVETMFLIPSEEYAYVSSRLVREVAMFGGDLTGLVPDDAREALGRRASERSAGG